MTTLLQTYRWVWWWTNFEIRSTFGEVMAIGRVSCSFDSQVRILI